MNTTEVRRLFEMIGEMQETLEKILLGFAVPQYYVVGEKRPTDPHLYPPGYNLPEEELVKYEEMYEGLPEPVEEPAAVVMHREWGQPRVWDKLADVPIGVEVVDACGDHYRFFDGHWHYGRSSSSCPYKIDDSQMPTWGVTDDYAPFLEVL